MNNEQNSQYADTINNFKKRNNGIKFVQVHDHVTDLNNVQFYFVFIKGYSIHFSLATSSLENASNRKYSDCNYI